VEALREAADLAWCAPLREASRSPQMRNFRLKKNNSARELRHTAPGRISFLVNRRRLAG